MAKTYLEIYDPTGTNQLAGSVRDYFKLERSRSEMNVGQLIGLFPVNYAPLFMLGNDLRVDTQIRIFRSIGDNPAYLDLQTFWFVQEATEVQDSSGREYLEVRAEDAIGLLKRRVIPYDPTDAKADKTDQADDIMKAFVRENFGALATDTTRNISAYLTVAADTGSGLTIDVTVQHPTVLAALQETANISGQQNSYMSFDIICDPTTGLMEFRTFPVYRGNDHRYASGNQVFVGRNRGNLTNTRLTFSHGETTNYVYVFGGNIGEVKIYEEQQNSASILSSPFNRREYILNNGNEIDTTVLSDQADQYLRSHRPRMALTGDLVELDDFVYDLNFGYGDYLTIDDKDRSFDARLSAISITDENGEVIKAALVGDSI